MPKPIRTSVAGIALIAGFCVLPSIAPAVPDRHAPGSSANTQITLMIQADVDGFQNRRVEARLYEFDPRQLASEFEIDKRVETLNHVRGAETWRTFNLGAGGMVKPGKQYYVAVNLFDASGHRSHVGEKDGKRGDTFVLTAGKPRQITMVVRKATPRDVVHEIADEIRKGNDVKATKLAQVRAKYFDELYDIMSLYRPRSKRGMGWGSTPPLANVPDGLEVKLTSLSRAVPANFAEDQSNNMDAGYWIAALAELTLARDSEFKPIGNKTKADWHQKSSLLRLEAMHFVKAAAARDADAIQKSARAINNACAQCHTVYRD